MSATQATQAPQATPIQKETLEQLRKLIEGSMPDLKKYEKMLLDAWKKFGTDKRTSGYRPLKERYGHPKIINHPSVTMAVNGQDLIVSPFFPFFLEQIEVGADIPKMIGNLFEHEMIHDLHGHLVAFNAYKNDGKRVWDLVNIAADLATNSILIKDGQKLPKDCCIPETGDFVDLPLGRDALWYFDKVVEMYKDKANIPDEQGEGEEGEGDGEGDGEGEGKEGEGEGKPSQGQGNGKGKGKGKGQGQPSQGQGQGQPSQGQGQGQPSQGQQGKGQGSKGKDNPYDEKSVDTDGISDTSPETKAQKDFRERNKENSEKTGGQIEVDEQAVQDAIDKGMSSEEAGTKADKDQTSKKEKIKRVEEEANKPKENQPDDNGVSDDMCIHHGIKKGQGYDGSNNTDKLGSNKLIPSCLNWERLLDDIIYKSKDEENQSYATPHMIKSGYFSELTNGVMYPNGRVENIPEILMIVDCSGSMADYYKICFTEIGAILDTYCQSASVRLISFDTRSLKEFLFIRGIPASTRTMRSVIKPGKFLEYIPNATGSDIHKNQVYVLQNDSSFARLMEEFDELRSGGGTDITETLDQVDAFRPEFSKVILLSDFQFGGTELNRLREQRYSKWIYLYLWAYSFESGPNTRYTDPSYAVSHKGVYHLDAPNLKKHYKL